MIDWRFVINAAMSVIGLALGFIFWRWKKKRYLLPGFLVALFFAESYGVIYTLAFLGIVPASALPDLFRPTAGVLNILLLLPYFILALFDDANTDAKLNEWLKRIERE